MKLDHDAIKEKYLRAGDKFGAACGKATREIKQTISDWLIDGGNILVVFGPPGAGKSWFINKLREDPKTLIVETSGLVAGINTFLNRIPRAEFITVIAPEEVCAGRVRSRDKRLLDDSNTTDRVTRLVKSWFARYNSLWNNKLPSERKITITLPGE